MREIKFRAWIEKYNGYRLLYSAQFDPLSNDGNIISIIFGHMDKGSYTTEKVSGGFALEQYVGQLDADGNEIFEGDILQDEFGAMVIKWSDEYSDFSLRSKDGSFCGWGDEDAGYLSGYEVIGNIHENKELLEGEKS